MSSLQKPTPLAQDVDDSAVDLENSAVNLIKPEMPLSNMESPPKLGPTEEDIPEDGEKEKEGIHHKATTKYGSSGLISADDDKNETDIGDESTGVLSAVGPIKTDFTALQQRIFETENELERIENRFYTIVSRRSIELEGINDMTEAEIERHR